MNFGIFLSNEAAKILKNLDEEVKYRIIEKLKLLEKGPFILPYKENQRKGKYLSHQDWRFREYILFMGMKLEY